MNQELCLHIHLDWDTNIVHGSYTSNQWSYIHIHPYFVVFQFSLAMLHWYADGNGSKLCFMPYVAGSPGQTSIHRHHLFSSRSISSYYAYLCSLYASILLWRFPEMRVPQNGEFFRGTSIYKIDDFGSTHISGTPLMLNICLYNVEFIICHVLLLWCSRLELAVQQWNMLCWAKRLWTRSFDASKMAYEAVRLTEPGSFENGSIQFHHQIRQFIGIWTGM